MSVPLTLLSLLDRAPTHGYDLKREYDELFGETRPLRFGQIYSTLSRLVRDGLADVGEAEPGAGPDRKTYRVTGAGHQAVDAWLLEPVPADLHLRTLLFVKVVLALLLGKDPSAYLDAQRAAHLDAMHELTEAKRAGDPLVTVLADYGLFHAEADLRWIEATEGRLGPLRDRVVA